MCVCKGEKTPSYQAIKSSFSRRFAASRGPVMHLSNTRVCVFMFVLCVPAGKHNLESTAAYYSIYSG